MEYQIPVLRSGELRMWLLKPLNNGLSSNGRTTDFESVYLGSNPSEPTKIVDRV